MNLETFFDKLELFADAPDAVAKMRELVLELAVRGRLSERRRADVTPEWKALIDRIDYRENLIDSEPPFDIPHAWRWVMLDDLGSCRVRNDVADDIRTSFVPMAMVPVKYGDAVAFEEKPWRDVKKGFTHFADGDVIMAKITPCFENGKSAVVRGLANGIGAGTTELHVFRRSTQQVLPEYVLVYIKSRGFIARGESVMTGSAGQKRVPRDYFSSSPFPLPPLAEQKRIVAKVDELMALCDLLEAQQQERETLHAALARASLARFAEAPTPANLEFLFHNAYDIPPADLRKSILTLAIQGKLVSQDASDEPVDVSLARSDEQRRKIAAIDRRADAENALLLSEADRWDVPESWSWRGLSDLVLFVDYRGKTPAKLSRGIRLLTAKNVRKGRIELSPEEFLSETEYRKWMTRGFPKAGDVLFTTEAPMGNAAVVELTERFALAQRVICFQAYGAIDSQFLTLQISSEQFQTILDKNGTGVTAKGIKASKLKRLPIAVPPLSEQRRIVAKVDELMALVDKLETQLAAARTTAANLLAAAVVELTRDEQHIVVSGRPPKIEQRAVV